MSEPLWVPTPESLERAEITRYLRRLEERTGRRFDSYDELWQWSVADLDGFWASVWDHFGLDAVSSYEAVLADDRMPGAVWFPGARLNFAERCLAPGADDDTALVLVGEGEIGLNEPVEVTYGELRRQVAAVAATLRRLGVQPGDKVAGYLPNVAEATVALLATAAAGAVWTVASPDFGTPSVLARFEQAEPVVLIAADGYRFGGKPYDRRATVAELVAGLPSVRTVLTRSHKLGKFDLIYASGLYDYLQHNVAVKLTKTCLQMLKPNGTFLFANYAEGTPDAGYRETFMDWVLLLRSEVDMWNIVNASVDRNAVEAKVYFGENRNVLYAVIEKRG